MSRCTCVNTFADGTAIRCTQDAAGRDGLCGYDRKVQDGLLEPGTDTELPHWGGGVTTAGVVRKESAGRVLWLREATV